MRVLSKCIRQSGHSGLPYGIFNPGKPSIRQFIGLPYPWKKSFKKYSQLFLDVNDGLEYDFDIKHDLLH
jgi:hypothetical protein